MCKIGRLVLNNSMSYMIRDISRRTILFSDFAKYFFLQFY